jgi:hypothetical protein
LSSLGFPDDQERALAHGEVALNDAAVPLPNPPAGTTYGPYPVAHATALRVMVAPTGGDVTVTLTWTMAGVTNAASGTSTLTFLDGTAESQLATCLGHLVTLKLVGSVNGVTCDVWAVPANPLASSCLVVRNLFPCRAAAEGGAGDLVWGGRTATYVADAAASDGTALEFAAVAATWAALIAGVTVDEYNISPFFKPSPAPFSTDPPFTPFAAYFYACLLRVRARITVAGATYRLTVSAADNVVPPGSAISIARADTFDVTDQGVRELPGGNFSVTEDPVTRAIASTTFENYDFYLTQVPTVVTAGGPQVLVYGWKTAGAGTVHVDTVDFRWARVALT